MENLVINMFDNVYKNTSVFITGHTGFKGSWLALWLEELGARITGFALPPTDKNNHWDMLKLDVNDIRGDIRDLEHLTKSINEANPSIVFHLAAQPLVRQSYADPIGNWSTNVMGTVNLLQACRECKSIKSIVVITTDKVYENNEWYWGYRETDKLGGHDPYSASKAASEFVISSYQKSFFQKEASIYLASARAGNVIGGGDWSVDRLIPDVARSVKANIPLLIRSPFSTRPWQHVLDCLSGYLTLGKELLVDNINTSEAWNFGPAPSDNRTVLEILGILKDKWPEISWTSNENSKSRLHEAGVLYLDSSKARNLLQWKTVWSLETALWHTANWYQNWESNPNLLSRVQLREYISDAKQKRVIWVQE